MSRYFDNASTTPLHPAALEAMTTAAAETFADPSRLYGDARKARILLDSCRNDVARTVGARAEEIVFTSGGTESCNLAVVGGARAARAARRPARVVVGAIEHTAVLEAARSLDPEGFEVTEVGVGRDGLIDLEALRLACEPGAALVSVQLANNEVGTIQPVEQVAAIAKQAGALMHTDAVMGIGHIPVDVTALGVDLLSGSAHKAYGPKGTGFMWARRGVRVKPMALGDDRERRRRAGIENLPAIAGMATALRVRADDMAGEAETLRGLTDRLRSRLPADVRDLAVHGHPSDRLPGIVSFSILYVEGEALLLALDKQGFAVHSGSSCTASTQEPSHVLAAMGVMTQGSIRVSLGRETTSEDVDAFIDALPPIVEQARKLTGADRLPDG